MTNYTLWPDTKTFGLIEDSTTNATVAGTVFKTTVGGYVTALRVYVPATGGTLMTVASLRLWQWATDPPVMLADVAGTTSSVGWMTVPLTTPVALTPGQNYVVSYLASNGLFPVERNVSNVALVSGPLQTIPSSTTANGRFETTGSHVYPELQGGSNPFYAADVVFSTGAGTLTASPTGRTSTLALGSPTRTVVANRTLTARASTLTLGSPTRTVIANRTLTARASTLSLGTPTGTKSTTAVSRSLTGRTTTLALGTPSRTVIANRALTGRTSTLLVGAPSVAMFRSRATLGRASTLILGTPIATLMGATSALPNGRGSELLVGQPRARTVGWSRVQSTSGAWTLVPPATGAWTPTGS